MDTNDLYVVKKASDNKYIIVEGELLADHIAFKLGGDNTCIPFHDEFKVFDCKEEVCNHLGLEYTPNKALYVSTYMSINWPLCNTSLEDGDKEAAPQIVAPYITKYESSVPPSHNECLFTPFIQNSVLCINITISLHGKHKKDINLVMQKDALGKVIEDVLVDMKVNDIEQGKYENRECEVERLETICDFLEYRVKRYEEYTSLHEPLKALIDLTLLNHIL